MTQSRAQLLDRIKTLEAELAVRPTIPQMRDVLDENKRLQHRFDVTVRRNEILNARLRDAPTSSFAIG